MKKKIIILISAFVVAISCFSLGVFAATKYRLVVNGKSIKTDIREINGTLYAPIKSIADSIGGLEYKFDTKTNTIKITSIKNQTKNDQQKEASKDTTSNPPQENPGIGFARSNPAPVGTEVVFESTGNENYEGTMKIEEVVRGDSAFSKLLEANRFNDAPPVGYEYISVKFQVKITKNSKPDTSIKYNKFNFNAVSAEGKDYKFVSVVEPDPELNANLYSGASDNGWVTFLIKKNDVPLITYGRAYDGSGGLWFEATSTTNLDNANTSNTNNNQDNNQNNINTTPTAISPESIRSFLSSNYSTLQTTLGSTSFTFDILENKTTIFPYDYWIQVEYDLSFFNDLEFSNKLSDQQRDSVKAELKTHIEKLGRAVIDKFPGKKFTGNYYKSWYRYPNIQVDLVSYSYFTWTNYNPAPMFSTNEYRDTTPSVFQWDPTIDNKL